MWCTGACWWGVREEVGKKKEWLKRAKTHLSQKIIVHHVKKKVLKVILQRAETKPVCRSPMMFPLLRKSMAPFLHIVNKIEFLKQI